MDQTTRVIYTQGMEHVQFNVLLVGAGAAAPTFVAGDKIGSSTGNYLVIARTSAGIYTITTVDKFIAVVGYDVTVALAAGASNVVAVYAPLPVKNANATWTFTANLYVAGTLTDLANTQQMSLQFTFQNNITGP
jgi:hypothetical protein